MKLTHTYGNLTGGRWLRGNLHTHTTRSDGARTLQQVLEEYVGHGHDFLMISDHDVFTSAEDYKKLDARGMIFIAGNEITANGPHILDVNARGRIEPYADRQQVLDAINAAGGGFAIINHPNWQPEFNHCPQEDLEKWKGYRGIEIFNGVIGRLAGSQFATDRWDRLLSKGRRVWGFANDDFHKAGESALGWNVAYVKEETPAGVVSALSDGRFYASTGVNIRKIEINGTRVRIETENADRIVASTLHQKRFAVVDRSSLEVDLAEYPNVESYVRFECMGRGEQFAWTQPIYVEK